MVQVFRNWKEKVLLTATSEPISVFRNPSNKTGLCARCVDASQVTRYIMGHKSCSTSLGILRRVCAMFSPVEFFNQSFDFVEIGT